MNTPHCTGGRRLRALQDVEIIMELPTRSLDFR